MTPCTAIFLERSVTHNILAVAATVAHLHEKHSGQVTETEKPPGSLEELCHMVHFDLRSKTRNHGSSVILLTI